MILPPGPVPVTCRRSRPCSRAMRRAIGEAGIRGASSSSAPSGLGASFTAWGTLSRGAAFSATPGIGSSRSAIMATTSPTGTVCPSGTRIFRRIPELYASTSTVTLVVSTSAMMSPRLTSSPSCFRHRNRCLLEILGVGQRNLHTGDATDRRIQVIESLLLNSACDLCTDPVRTPGLLDGERSMRLPDRGEHPLHVKGAETPEVHHLSLDPLLTQELGRLERHQGHPGVGHEGDMLPLPLDLGLPQGDQMLPLRHLSPDAVEQGVLDEEDRIVVPDGALQEPLPIGGRGRRARARARGDR